MNWYMHLKEDPHRLIPIQFGKSEDYEARQAMIESIEKWLEEQDALAKSNMAGFKQL